MDSKPKVLLIGWDAADWEHIQPLLEKGQLPALKSLMDRGVWGNIGTLQPILSPMLWNSVATGKQAWKHGIHGFVEKDPFTGGARPFSSHSRKTKALWNILTQNSLRCNVVNWWASHPAEPVNGCIVSNLFSGIKMKGDGSLSVPSGCIHPPALIAELAQNKVYPEELQAQELLPFVPNGAKLNQDEDDRLSYLANSLAEMLTTHSVATAVMEQQPWDFMAVYSTAIDHFCHTFMPYHPPQLPWISDADFAMYSEVISSVYRFSDLTLQRMLDLAGPETTVILCSDHGFQSKENRPATVPNEPAGPAFWHRRFGVFVAAGPGIKPSGQIFGTTLLDIAPTVLALFGLPMGRDMDGRVLAEILTHDHRTAAIASWDAVPGACGELPPETAPANPEEAEELLRQFVALGYIEAPGESKEEQGQMADREARYNLARNLNWCAKHQDSLAILRGLVEESPWETRFVAQLIRCTISCANFTMAEQLLKAAYDLNSTQDPLAWLMWADLLSLSNREEEALPVLDKVYSLVRQPAALCQIGRHYLRFRKYQQAEMVFRTALERHAENSNAWEGLSSVYCRTKRYQEAVDAALRATELVFHSPVAHLNMGIAFLRSGAVENATAAFKTAARFAPDLVAAHRWLAVIARYREKNESAVGEHRREGNRVLETARWRRPELKRRAAEVWEVPAIPTEAERFRILSEKRPPQESPAARTGKCFTIVSGLPRSGTSLMMQMLQAAGMEPRTDGERQADGDNPRGYYEWEEIKQLPRRPAMLQEEGLDRKSIKVISMLLPHLPYQHEYRVIFMTRPAREIAASQAAMIVHRETHGADLETEALISQLDQHSAEALTWLQKHPRAKVLEVSYPVLLASPETEISRVAEFLKGSLPNPNRMATVIDPKLYRNRV